MSELSEVKLSCNGADKLKAMPDQKIILLALENEHISKLFERSFGASSYSVITASDRAVLENKLQQVIPAAVIISVDFSDTQGLEIGKSLVERIPTLPVLLYAAIGSMELLQTSLQAGFSDCLFSPLKPSAITSKVENALVKANRMGDWLRREVRSKTDSLEHRVNELQKLVTILDNIDDGVIILDSEDHILLINPSAKRDFGLGNAELNGTRFDQVIPNEDLLALMTMGKSRFSHHQEITLDDDRIFKAQYSTIPGVGVAITMQNITYLKQIDRIKNDFVSTVSHDLRTPLTAILGYVELMDRVGPLNDQQREFIRRVQISIHDITSLVNDLLELGRLEAGILGNTMEVSLEQVLKNSVDNLQPQIQEKKVVLNQNYPSKTPSILGNPVRIRQMLDNLLGNAVKYSPPGGEVTVGISVEENQVVFSVKDTGMGIPAADQPHIFEKFYRGSNVEKKVTGSGLGLAIVKSIVESHQGRIWVDSIPGKGSTFYVVLPTAAQQVELPKE